MASASNSIRIYAPASSTYGYTLSISFNETGTNISNNTSDISFSASLSSDRIGFSTTTNHVLAIYWHDNRENTDVYINSVNVPSLSQNSSISVSGSRTVTHNSDGNLSGYAFASWTKNSSNSYVPNSANSITAWTALTSIPRYANITSFSVSRIDETSVRYNWSANASCDWAWYSTNNGASWNNLPSNNIITGLTAGTSYNFKLRVRRQDSQLTTDSGTYTQSTYAYPYCTSSPNFIIGNSLTLTFYNPLSRSITITGIGKDNATIFSGTTSGTSLSGFNSASDIQNQYNSIPNDTSSTYSVRVVYGSSTKIRSNNNTYSVNANTSKPTFENFEYSTDLSELTGNNNTIINGRTTTTFTISTTNKAIANNGSTISRYVFICDAQTKQANYSSTSSVSSTIPNCTSNIIKATAIDSRGLETTVTKTIPNFKNYYQPSFVSYNADRQNGVETTTYLDLKLNFWNSNFGDEDNEIISLKYRVKESNSSDWSNWFSINESQLVIVNEEATLENYLIYLDGISTGFTIGTQYDLQLQVSDGAGNTVLNTIESDTFILTDGIVAFSILKDNNGNYHLGINGMPDVNYTLKVHGTINSN